MSHSAQKWNNITTYPRGLHLLEMPPLHKEHVSTQKWENSEGCGLQEWVGGTTNCHSWVVCYPKATENMWPPLLQSLSLLARNTALDTTAWSPYLHTAQSQNSEVRAAAEYQWLHVSMKSIYIPQFRLQFLNDQHRHQTKSFIQYTQWFTVSTPHASTPRFHCIMLQNCPILTRRVMQSCLTATSTSCHSPDLLHLSPSPNSNTRSSYLHAQPGAAETEHLLP